MWVRNALPLTKYPLHILGKRIASRVANKLWVCSSLSDFPILRHGVSHASQLQAPHAAVEAKAEVHFSIYEKLGEPVSRLGHG